jgi:hypothetical protein
MAGGREEEEPKRKNGKLLCISCRKTQCSYGLPGQSAKYCTKCKLDGMIHLYSRKCVVCKIKRASFNVVGQRADYCGSCKDDNMVHIYRFNSCQKRGIEYKVIRKRKIGVRRKHIEKRLCVACKTIRANFNFPGQPKGKYCNSCKLDGMVNVLQKKCVVCRQNKCRVFNFIDKPARFCKDCKLPGMINKTCRKCVVCKKPYPKYNFLPNQRPIRCSSCKIEGMVNVAWINLGKKSNVKRIKVETQQAGDNFPSRKINNNSNGYKIDEAVMLKASPKMNEGNGDRVVHLVDRGIEYRVYELKSRSSERVDSELDFGWI